MNVCLTILGSGLLCDEGGEACPKNGIKQMIEAYLGVMQALFDLSTVFTVKQNNSHKDCSIFNLLKFIETLWLNVFSSSPFSPLPNCPFSYFSVT